MIVVGPSFKDWQVGNSVGFIVCDTVFFLEVVRSNLQEVRIHIVHRIDTNTVKVGTWIIAKDRTNIHDVVEPV